MYLIRAVQLELSMVDSNPSIFLQPTLTLLFIIKKQMTGNTSQKTCNCNLMVGALTGGYTTAHSCSEPDHLVTLEVRVCT